MCRIYQAGLCEFSKKSLDALSAQYHCIGFAASAICLLEALFLVQARDDPIWRAASAADMAAVQDSAAFGSCAHVLRGTVAAGLSLSGRTLFLIYLLLNFPFPHILVWGSSFLCLIPLPVHCPPLPPPHTPRQQTPRQHRQRSHRQRRTQRSHTQRPHTHRDHTHRDNTYRNNTHRDNNTYRDDTHRDNTDRDHTDRDTHRDHTHRDHTHRDNTYRDNTHRDNNTYRDNTHRDNTDRDHTDRDTHTQRSHTQRPHSDIGFQLAQVPS